MRPKCGISDDACLSIAACNVCSVSQPKRVVLFQSNLVFYV